MTSYKRGDVVLVFFPHSDLETYSKRPALVVQDEQVHTGISQKIVAMITTNLARQGPTRIIVSKNSLDGRRMGIIRDSVIVADNLATILETQIDKTIGYCPNTGQLDSALRKILRL